MMPFWTVIFTTLLIICSAPKALACKPGKCSSQSSTITDSEIKSMFDVWRSSASGIEGQITVAQNYFNDDIDVTYDRVSSVLSQDQMRALAWKNIQRKVGKSPSGTTLRAIRQKLLAKNPDRSFVFAGPRGVVEFARQSSISSLEKARALMHAYLTPKEYSMLKLRKTSNKTLDEVNGIRALVLDKNNGNDRYLIQGVVAYERVAKYLQEQLDVNSYELSMTFVRDAIVESLTANEVKGIALPGSFHGTLAEFSLLQMSLSERNGNGELMYKGVDGLYRYLSSAAADESAKVHSNIMRAKTALNKELFNELGWGSISFGGTLSELMALRSLFLQTNESGAYTYAHPEGAELFAITKAPGLFNVARENVHLQKLSTLLYSVVTQSEKEAMGWEAPFEGTLAERQEVAFYLMLKNSSGEFFFDGDYGYALYAHIFYYGDMTRAYKDMNSLSFEQRKNLGYDSNANRAGWKMYQKSLLSFLELKNISLPMFNVGVKKFNQTHDGEIPLLDDNPSSGAPLCLSTVPNSSK